MSDSVETFERDGLVVTVSVTGDRALITWRGTSDARDPGAILNPYLSRLAARLGGMRVTLDFRLFEYMNSATVAPLIAFIKALDGRGARSVLLYDTKLSWQRVNFQCMKTIARTLKSVDVQGA
jgi:hypothetical protein